MLQVVGDEVLVKIGLVKGEKKGREGVSDKARNYLLGLSFLRDWSSRLQTMSRQS